MTIRHGGIDSAGRHLLMSSSLQQRIARNVRRLRTARGLTQEQLADITGVAAAQISRIETGSRNTTLTTIEAIAAGLGCDLVDLIGVHPGASDLTESEARDVLGAFGRLGVVERAALMELMGVGRIPSRSRLPPVLSRSPRRIAHQAPWRLATTPSPFPGPWR